MQFALYTGRKHSLASSIFPLSNSDNENILHGRENSLILIERENQETHKDMTCSTFMLFSLFFFFAPSFENTKDM